MKKILTLLLMVALIASLTVIVVHADGGGGTPSSSTATIKVTASTKTPYPGKNQITYTFSIEATNGLSSVQFKYELPTGITQSGEPVISEEAKAAFPGASGNKPPAYSDKGYVASVQLDNPTNKTPIELMTLTCDVDATTAPVNADSTLKLSDVIIGGGDKNKVQNPGTQIDSVRVTHGADNSDYHAWGVPSTTEPTCTKDGTKTFTCQNSTCNKTKTEKGEPATGHALTLTSARDVGVANQFTWNDDGEASTATAWVKCINPSCDGDYRGEGKSVTVKVEPNGTGDGPTCTSGGSVGYTGTVTIEDAKHAGGAWRWTQEHTKTFSTGLGHNYDVSKVTWSEFQQSTPTAQMTATLDCTRCGAAGRITATANPTIQSNEKVAATCKAAGYDVYKATVNFKTSNVENEKAPNQDITEEWHVPIDQLQHQWQEENAVTVNWTGPDDNKTITDTVKVTCSRPGCDYNSNGYELRWNITSSGTPASCEKDGDLTWTAKATIPALDITPAKTYTKTTTTMPTATGHNIGENVTFNWPTSYTSNDENALKSQVTATATCSNTNCDQKNTLTGTVTGVVKYTDGGDQPEWKEPNYVENGTYVFKATASFDKVADGGSSRTVTRDGYKFYTIDPLEPEVKAPSVDDKADAITENTAADGKLQDNVSDMVAAALASSTQTPGMEEKLYNAIREAGGSTTENDLQIDTKLVVDNADTATVASSITSVLADNVKDAFNIYIEVTVTSRKLGSRTETGFITEIADPIDFTATLPNGGPIWYVMSDHGGSWNKIKSHVDGGNIVFTTNQFSNFVLISSNDLADADIQPDPIPAQKWTGKAIEPQITVTINGGEKTLELGKDYTISYENNVDASNSAKIIIKAVEGGDYTGSKEVTFTITKDPVKATAKPSAAPTAPNTGDETPVGLYATVVIVCAAALTALVVVLVRRRRHQR